MRIEFDYRPERGRTGEVVYRPVGKVFIEHGGNKFLIYPYIDSGADITLIPRSIGEALGLKFEQNEIRELRGIGEGKIAMVIKSVQMTVGEYTFPCSIAWALTEKVPLLLGRRDIFERFEVIFREWEKKVLFILRKEIT